MEKENHKLNKMTFIVGCWTVLTTLATLYLGVKTYSNASAKDILESREKLDQFVIDTRKNYIQRCNSETETMRESWSERYELLLRLANVDADKVPYSQICKEIIYGVPKAPENLKISISYPHPVTTYKDWEEFNSSVRKVATLWVEDIPVEIDITSGDFSPLKERIEMQRDDQKNCTNREREKPENKYNDVECKFGIDENNETTLVPVVNRK